MEINEMTLEEKKNALFDWIRNLDEQALNDLLAEYLGFE